MQLTYQKGSVSYAELVEFFYVSVGIKCGRGTALETHVPLVAAIAATVATQTDTCSARTTPQRLMPKARTREPVS